MKAVSVWLVVGKLTAKARTSRRREPRTQTMEDVLAGSVGVGDFDA
jgi:hypothetical protein